MIMQHARPKSLDEALSCLQQDQFRIIAGGTDFYPSLGDGVPASSVLDITAIDELRGWRLDDAGLTIGALCTWTEIRDAQLPPAFHALQLAATEVGSVQIQNRATIAGNLCNASPAADGVPPLLILDASVNLASSAGTRSVPLAEFIQGNRKITKANDEIVISISIPAASCYGYSDFLKLGARKYLVISIAMVACKTVIEDGVFTSVAISVGSCSEVARRLHSLEQLLTGKSCTDEIIEDCVTGNNLQLSPIDDVRSSALYRNQAASALVTRTLKRCMQADGADS